MATTPTAISDLWVPAVWTSAGTEARAKRPSLFNSGAVVRSPAFDALASDAGLTVNVPFFKDITDQADEIQAENTAANVTISGGGIQIGVPLNRQTANSFTGLAAFLTGDDPAQSVIDQLADRSLKQGQTSLVFMLRGLFGTALNACRLNISQETTVGLSSANYLDGDDVIDGATLLGENADLLKKGFLFLHSVVAGELRKQDSNAFVQHSKDGVIVLETYRGIPVFTSDSLSRAGTTSGTVYETYLIAPGSIAYGEKPQSNKIGDVASLVVDGNASLNNETIYDRARKLIHVAGTKWTGTPAGQSPTNAELATSGNWALAFTEAKRCGIVQILSNK